MTIHRIDAAWAAFFGLSPPAFLRPDFAGFRQSFLYRGDVIDARQAVSLLAESSMTKPCAAASDSVNLAGPPHSGT
jgi:hypothetical protein